MDNKILNVLLEMQEFCEFFLQKYSDNYDWQNAKTGFEAQHLEWQEKRRILQELIVWLETNVFELGNEEEKTNL